MAQLTRETAYNSIAGFFADCGADQTFTVTGDRKTASILATDADGKSKADAQKAVGEVFNSAAADAVFAVTKNKGSLTIAIVSAASAAGAAKPAATRLSSPKSDQAPANPQPAKAPEGGKQ